MNICRFKAPSHLRKMAIKIEVWLKDSEKISVENAFFPVEKSKNTRKIAFTNTFDFHREIKHCLTLPNDYKCARRRTIFLFLGPAKDQHQRKYWRRELCGGWMWGWLDVPWFFTPIYFHQIQVIKKLNVLILNMSSKVSAALLSTVMSIYNLKFQNFYG